MAVVDHWKLDDNAASTTVVATAGVNGTLNGGDNTSVKTAAGPGGTITSSFLLNGVDDDITITGASLPTGSAASFDCWFKIGTLATNMAMTGTGANATNRISVGSDTTIQVRVSAARTFTVPSLGTGWHHLLVTKTVGDNWRVFIDAVESSTGIINDAGSVTPTRLGVGSTSGQWWSGNLANARFHDTDESANAATWYAEGNASPPVITYNSGNAATISVEEGVTAVATITATGSGVTFSLTGGADAADFSINSSSGVLVFAVAPDYDAPADSDVNNSYALTVTATNVAGTDSIAITVNVTDYPTTRVSLLRHAIRTTTGTDNYTISGLGLAQRIKAAFRFGNSGISDGVAANGAFYGYGMSVPATTNRSTAVRMEHGATTDREGHVSLEYWRKITLLNATDALSVLTGFIQDGLSVTVNPAPAAAILDHILFFAGDDIEASIEEGMAAVQGSNIEFALDFTPTLLIIIQSDDGWDDSPSHLGFSPHAITFVSRSSAGVVSTACLAISGIHLDADVCNCYGTASTKSVFWDPTKSVAGPEAEYTISFPDATTLRIATDVFRGIDNPNTFAVLALRFGDRETQVGIATLGTGTGAQAMSLSPAPAFTPETFVCLPSRITAVDTNRIASDEAGVAGVAAVTRPAGFAAGNGEYCSTIAFEQGASTSNSQSLTDDKLIAIPNDDGTSLAEASFSSFGVGTVNINVTSSPGTALKLPYFAVSDGVVIGGGGGGTGGANLLLLGVG